MGIPKKHAIPTRKDWQKLRDQAGGKSGEAKVSVGPALDSFHKALEKASKKDDPSLMNKELNNLQKVITAYVSEMGKKNPKVAKVAKEKVQFALKDFIANCSAPEGEDKGQEETVRSLESRIRDAKKYGDSVKDFMGKSEKAVRNLEAQVESGKIPDATLKKLKEVHSAMLKNLDKLSTAGVKLRTWILDDEKKLGKEIEANLKKAASTGRADLDEAFNQVQELKRKLQDLKKGLK